MVDKQNWRTAISRIDISYGYRSKPFPHSRDQTTDRPTDHERCLQTQPNGLDDPKTRVVSSSILSSSRLHAGLQQHGQTRWNSRLASGETDGTRGRSCPQEQAPHPKSHWRSPRLQYGSGRRECHGHGGWNECPRHAYTIEYVL